MHRFKKFILSVCSMLLCCSLMAQNVAADSVDTRAMSAHGKIYVVMAIVITILAGLLLYVVRLDRKLARLEKEGI